MLILSGDQIYQMDFQDILATHRGCDGQPRADVTIGAVLVPRERARGLGVLRLDDNRNVSGFREKPGDDDLRLEGLEASPRLLEPLNLPSGSEPWYLANMGIYVFDLDKLEAALANGYSDFGKEVLPSLLASMRVRAHLFHGYWEDVGTVGSFHEANLELASPQPRFNFFVEDSPIYTRARLLPASRIGKATLTASLISDGCLIEEATIEESLIGIRSIVGRGCTLRRTYVIGADYYENEADRAADREQGIPPLGIGDGSDIEDAIIDKNARVGRNVRISNRRRHEEYEDGVVVIRDGVVVVPRGGVVPDGYRL